MEKKDFEIGRGNYSVIIQKDNQGLAVTQTIDGGVWFSTSQKVMAIELDLSSTNYSEWQTYLVFECLMKSIVGRYILNGDNKDFSCLPKDFIDLENKVIIYHSDRGANNFLKLEYNEGRNIKISMQECEGSMGKSINYIKIEAQNSEYGYYYREFLEFFQNLTLLEQRLNGTVENVQQERKDEYKKMSFFKRFNNKK